MRNRVYLVDISFKISAKDVALYYHIYEVESPIEEYMLCMGNAIFINEGVEGVGELNFPGKIITVTPKLIKSLEKKPLEVLDELVGRKRMVNPRQFELIIGSVVRSKVSPIIGPGIVTAINGDIIEVKFPKATELYEKDTIECHPSTLRVVTHIEEVKHEAD